MFVGSTWLQFHSAGYPYVWAMMPEMVLKMFDRKIEYFFSVVEEKSFSAAARKLFLTQAALSKQITSLENELDIKLFDRSGYRPVLTEAGNRYYKKCRALNKEYETFLKGLSSEYRTNLHIGFTGAFENRRALGIVRSVLADNEWLHIEFCHVSFNDSLRMLLNQELDAALGIEATFRNNRLIDYDTLYQNEICVICSFHHPLSAKQSVTIDDIRDEKMILLSEKYGAGYYKAFMEACRLDSFQPNVVKEADTFDELVTSVSIGEGIAIASKDVVRETELCVIDLLASNPQSNYVIAYLKSNRNAAVHALVEGIKLYNREL